MKESKLEHVMRFSNLWKDYVKWRNSSAQRVIGLQTRQENQVEKINRWFPLSQFVFVLIDREAKCHGTDKISHQL